MKKDGIRCRPADLQSRNLSGDGSIEPRNSGLTNLGRDTIRRIEAEKLLLDLSHGGARTIDEAIAFAKRPLVISHTGARALTDHPRNVADATIKAVADKGGVVGVYFMPYLRPRHAPERSDADRPCRRIANVAGEDHVGIGTDNSVLPTILDAKAIEAARKIMSSVMPPELRRPAKRSASFRWSRLQLRSTS